MESLQSCLSISYELCIAIKEEMMLVEVRLRQKLL